MNARVRALAFMAATVALIWLVAAAIVAAHLYGHRAERAAHYVDVDLARSFATQGRPDFVALRGRVAAAGPLALRRGHQADTTWYVPLVASVAAEREPVRWIVRYEGPSLPSPDRALLAQHAADTPPQVVRDEFERADLHVGPDAVVVDWIPSRDGVVLDRDADTIAFATGVAGFVSAVVILGRGMLALSNARHARDVPGDRDGAHPGGDRRCRVDPP